MTAEERRLSSDAAPLTRGDFKILMTEHEAKEEKNQEERLAKFMSAFPGGDPVKHCQFHQAKIDAAVAEKRFWEIAQGKVVEKGIEGIFGVLKIVVLLTLTGAAVKLGLAPLFLGAGK